jgi:hypothetical protein
MDKGRPSENTEINPKFTRVYKDVPTKPEIGEISTWKYDLDKFKNGPISVSIEFPKNTKFPKPEIDKNQQYGVGPVVMVFKTSERKNAKTRMKVWKNTNIDYINEASTLSGVPDNAPILELGVGESYINMWKNKYDL